MIGRKWCSSEGVVQHTGETEAEAGTSLICCRPLADDKQRGNAGGKRAACAAYVAEGMGS